MTSARKRLASGVLLASLFLLISVSDAHALPAFARKYGLRCSACHEAWPMLNYFGQKFKDNGYQLMNDRDAPIWQSNGYWPVTIRITPSWHRESTDKVAIDQTEAGSSGSPRTVLTWAALICFQAARSTRIFPSCSCFRRMKTQCSTLNR